MDKQTREQLKIEKIELLQERIIELQKEIEHFSNVSKSTLDRMEKELAALEFQKEVFEKSKI